MPMYRNVIGWYLQRITGALLILLLAAHFWVEHFTSAELRRGDLSYEAILHRISNPAWQFIDNAFLLVALYHGLNGLHNIILDYSRVGRHTAQALTVAIVGVGLVWACWGIDAFRNL
jgi:succinate dehydrogenase hydrophobic anchor subunit